VNSVVSGRDGNSGWALLQLLDFSTPYFDELKIDHTEPVFLDFWFCNFSPYLGKVKQFN
jgi:hypothetical protein